MKRVYQLYFLFSLVNFTFCLSRFFFKALTLFYTSLEFSPFHLLKHSFYFSLIKSNQSSFNSLPSEGCHVLGVSKQSPLLLSQSTFYQHRVFRAQTFLSQTFALIFPLLKIPFLHSFWWTDPEFLFDLKMKQKRSLPKSLFVRICSQKTI